MATNRRDLPPERGRGIPARVLNAVVGSVVSPVVDNVDVDDVVDRIDVNHLMEKVDVDAIVGRVDIDGIVSRVDIDGIVSRIDIDGIVSRIDIGAIVDQVDVDGLVAKVDVNGILERVDLNPVLDRLDLDQVVNRLDLNRLVQRLDLDAVLARVDLDAVVERIDLDKVLERVDVNKIMERTELGAVIARSTTGVFTQLLDVARTQLVVVDQVVHAVVGRLLHRPSRGVPGTPTDPADRPSLRGIPQREAAVALQGHYAGSVSRFLAFLLDQFILGVLFGLGFALTSAAVEVVFGVTLDPSDQRYLTTAAYFLWAFLYLAVPLAVAGRTIGKAVLGLLVVRADGSDLPPLKAAIRTACFPLSFLLFGVGFLIGLVRADRRELHDLLAGSAVLYAWDAETARLRAEELSHPLGTHQLNAG